MQRTIAYGGDRLEVEIAEDRLVSVRRQEPTPPLIDLAAAVRDTLEHPVGFPALRQALTPDDHVVIVIDEHLPHLIDLLVPILEHLRLAHIAPAAITLLSPPAAAQGWLDDLPDDFADVRTEVHDRQNKKQLSYLANTRHGRRLYLNRSVVDADQLIVLGRRWYDPLLGYGGAAGDLYPTLSDDATWQDLCARISLNAPGTTPWPVAQEAEEVAWLLGVPFLVQVIEGASEDIAHIMSGPVNSSGEGRRLLDARWRQTPAERAGTVVAAVSGDPARHDFADLARALACAARVVEPDGRIVLLSQANPKLGAGARILLEAHDPELAIKQLRQHKPPDLAPAYLWASAAQQAHIYLLSGIPSDTAEDLFTLPLDHAGQLQRLLEGKESCLFLDDAHKALAFPASTEDVKHG